MKTEPDAIYALKELLRTSGEPRDCTPAQFAEWRAAVGIAESMIESSLMPSNNSAGFLDWHKGPAEGGHGTAGTNDEGVPQWYDGDRLLIIIETNKGREMAIVDISCDEHFFRTTDASSGDAYDAWDPSVWSWWAKLDKHNLPAPPNIRDEPRGQTTDKLSP